MFAHTHMIFLSITLLIGISFLHEAFARPHRPQSATAARYAEPQNAQRHLVTATVFHAAAIGF